MSDSRNLTPKKARDRGFESLDRVARQLDAEIAELERTIGTLSINLAQLHAARKQIKAPAHRIGDERASVSDDGHPSNATGGKKRRPRANSDGELITNFAYTAIREAGRPLGRTEIYERMLAAGMQLRSKHPLKRIGKALWAADEFLNVARKGYWLVGVPLPKDLSSKKQQPRRALAA